MPSKRSKSAKSAKNPEAAGVAALLGLLAGRPGVLQAFMGSLTGKKGGNFIGPKNKPHVNVKQHRKAGKEAAEKARVKILDLSSHYGGSLVGTLRTTESKLHDMIATRKHVYQAHPFVKGTDKKQTLIARSNALKLPEGAEHVHREAMANIVREVNEEVMRFYTRVQPYLAKGKVSLHKEAPHELSVPEYITEPKEDRVDVRALTAWYSKAARTILLLQAAKLRYLRVTTYSEADNRKVRNSNEEAYLAMATEYEKLHKAAGEHRGKAKHHKKTEHHEHHPETPAHRPPGAADAPLPAPTAGKFKPSGLERLLSAAYPKPYAL